VGKLPRKPHGDPKVAEDVLSLIRLLIKRRRTEVYGTCQYKRYRDTEHAPASLLHCTLARQNSSIPILELLKLILEEEFDLEARDVNGNTPLLYALYYTPHFELVEVVTTLIKAGAKVSAVNKYDEGSLHLLLRRLSACNTYNMSSEVESSLIKILVMLLGYCDPTLSNVVGYTPLDAAFSPTAWPLLCSALERAGENIRNVILALDRRSNIEQSDAEIEERFAHVVACSTWTTSRPSESKFTRTRYTKEPCYLCGRRTEWRERKMPFDEFKSRVVDEIGFGIHMMLANHNHVGECLKVQETDSCHCLDYHPAEMSPEDAMERSWRRHVAYMLWREGKLSSPSESQRWAVGGKC
jgi:hypothetical protein